MCIRDSPSAAPEAAAPPAPPPDPNLAWLESEAPPEEPEGDADLTCCCNGCAACEATRVEVDGGRLACPEERKGERRYCPKCLAERLSAYAGWASGAANVRASYRAEFVRAAVAATRRVDEAHVMRHGYLAIGG